MLIFTNVKINKHYKQHFNSVSSSAKVNRCQDNLQTASDLDRAEVRTFCMMLVYTGCRISEELELSIDRVDLSAKTISIRTLKQRDKIIYRDLPVPDHLIDALKLVHHVQKLQKLKGGGKNPPLWNFQRTMAWKQVFRVMNDAGITGDHATPKGLRHGFGVRMAQKNP